MQLRRERGGPARVAWWLVLIALSGLAVPVLARLFGLEYGPLVFAIALVPWATVALVVTLLATVVLRAWTLTGVAAPLVALGLIWLAPLYVGPGASGEPVMHVATASMSFGEADADAVVELVRTQDIEVLALQEVTPGAVARLEQAGLNDLLPFSAVYAEEGFTGTGLWSRYPVTDGASLDGFVSHNIRAQVHAPVGTLTVYSVHPVAPRPRTHQWWEADLSRLVAELEAASGPVMVVGDFNATRDHRAFRDLEALGYRDAANQAVAGFLPTFPHVRAPFALVAIDHVMVRDANMVAADVSTVGIEGSDHRALVVTYVSN